jgi:hypothetical protein
MLMMHTKSVIIMILSLLFVPLVYGLAFSFFASDVYAEAPDSNYLSSGTCANKTTDPRTAKDYQTCCWTETERGPYPKIGTTEVRYCQTCSTPPGGSGPIDCKPKQVQLIAPPSAGESILQDDGIAEQPKQPIFDIRNDANVPPIGNIEQNPSTTQSSPGGSADISIEEKSEKQETTPQDNQNDNKGEDNSPPIRNQENALSDDGVVERPNSEQLGGQLQGAETTGALDK